jgi:hypothetical protein
MSFVVDGGSVQHGVIDRIAGFETPSCRASLPASDRLFAATSPASNARRAVQSWPLLKFRCDAAATTRHTDAVLYHKRKTQTGSIHTPPSNCPDT